MRLEINEIRLWAMATLRLWMLAFLFTTFFDAPARAESGNTQAGEGGDDSFNIDDLLGLDDLPEGTTDQEPAGVNESGSEPSVENHVSDETTSEGIQAKAPPKRKTLEEIVVVAQKQEASIQDVPISISVIDDQFIEEWSITDLNSAALYAPNVQLPDAGYFILPRIRGFGTDQNNKAFEPPAGVAIDGIPYTRLEYFTSALFDLERMEVYRGPQGTSFGKNTTAGLIHLITKSPTSEFGGFVDYQYGEFDKRRIEAAVGGPLIEGFLNYRLAGLSDDRTGFIENSAGVSLSGAPEFARGNDRKGFRLKLDFVDLFGSSLKLSMERVDILSTGAGLELFDVTETMQAVIRRYDPASDFVRGNYTNTINDPDFRKVDLETYKAEWNKDIGGWGVVVLGGYSVLDGSAALDTDTTPLPAIYATDADRSPTTTAELRLESPVLDGFLGLEEAFGLDLGSSNFLTGVYYQKREIDGDGIVSRIGLSYLDLLVASQTSSPDSQVPDVVDDLLGLLFPLIPPVLSDLGYTEEATQDFDQQAEAAAVFGQFQWQFLPAWGLEYGLRFNTEDKSAQFNQSYTSESALLLPVLGVEEYRRNLSISEDNVAQRASLNFEPNDDIGIFLHWAKGFRGGGFNAFSRTGNNEDLTYKEESATDWGLDFKTKLLDGRMRLNLSLFRLDVDDFQVLVGIPTENPLAIGSTKVENAAKARSQGIEGDLTWLVTDWFTLFSTLGVNDTEYLSFTNNTCFSDNPNTDGDNDPRCDVTGKPFPLTAKYNATMLGMATLPLTRSGLFMQIGGGFDFQSEMFTNTSLDDRYKQDDVTRWRASIGIGNIAQGWSFRLHGENLTDELVTIRQGQIVKGSVVEAVEAPRTVYGTLRYNF